MDKAVASKQAANDAFQQFNNVDAHGRAISRVANTPAAHFAAAQAAANNYHTLNAACIAAFEAADDIAAAQAAFPAIAAVLPDFAENIAEAEILLMLLPPMKLPPLILLLTLEMLSWLKLRNVADEDLGLSTGKQSRLN